MKTLKIITLCLLALSWTTVGAVDTIYDARFKRWQTEAEKGDADAQYKLGNAYLRGLEVAVNERKAITWLNKAANQGHAKANYKLAYLYYTGQGVKADSSRAFGMFKKSAEGGYSPAYYYVGKMYADGRGTGQDFDKALVWLGKAVEAGYSPAAETIKEVKADRAQARADARAEAKRDAELAAERERARELARKEARLQRAKAEPAPAPKPAVAKETDPRSMIVKSDWLLDGKPTEFLPSSLNNCKRLGAKTVCKTPQLEKYVMGSRVIYEVTTTLDEWGKGGKFTATIETNHLLVLNDDLDDPNPPAGSPTMGVQPNSPTFKCRMDGKNLECFDRVKVEKLVFTTR